MYCRNCANLMEPGSVYCSKCGVRAGDGVRFCPNCGAATGSNAAVCVKCGVALARYPSVAGGKSRLVAGLLGIFLGALGVHNFYLGYIGKGVAQLVLSIFSFGIIGGVWGLIEGILLLCGVIDRDGSGMPLQE